MTEDRRADNLSLALTLAVAVAIAMIAQQLAGKAIRDAFFLSQYPASALPTAMMVASGLSIAVVLGTTRMYRSIAPARLVPWVFLGSAVWFVGEWSLSLIYPKVAAGSLYIHTTSFGAVVVSGFWSVVNERFDPHTAKRVIGRIAGGATLGGVLGGLTAWLGGRHLPVSSLILILGFVNLACCVLMYALGRGVKETGPQKVGSKKPAGPSVLALMEETPYLWQLAFLVLTSALAAALFDYVFKAEAKVTFSSAEDLVGFFSLFYFGLGIGTFVFQQLFTGRALRHLGLTLTIASMPATVVGLGLLSLFTGGFGTIVTLRSATAILESSLYRSGYELLYTPLTPEKKRPTKTMIDVGFDKLGAALGSGLSLVVVQAFPAHAGGILLGFAVGAGTLGLYISTALHRGYVLALADSLKSRHVSEAELNLNEPLTKRAVDATRAILDKERAQASAPRPTLKRRATPAKRHPVSSVLDVTVEPGDVDDIVRGLAAFRSEDEARVRSTLRWFRTLPGELVPAALPLLLHPGLRREVKETLERLAPLHVGLFTDTLLSATRPSELRREMPDLLDKAPTKRSADALLLGLETDRFDLRFRSAIALRNIAHRNPKLEVDPLRVMTALEDTLVEADLGRWSRPSDGLLLGHVFTALSAVLPPEPLRLALEALSHGDSGERGTGLEYLENVLPDSLRKALGDRLVDREAARSAYRPETELLREIDETSRSAPKLDGLLARLRTAKRGA